MRVMVRQGNVVVNVIVAQSVAEARTFYPVDQGYEFFDATALSVSPGMIYDGAGGYSEPTKAGAFVEEISTRQFYQALALPPLAMISEVEALEATRTKEPPAALATVINTMTPADQYKMLMALASDTFNINHPFVAMFAVAMNLTPAQIRALWTLGASL